MLRRVLISYIARCNVGANTQPRHKHPYLSLPCNKRQNMNASTVRGNFQLREFCACILVPVVHHLYGDDVRLSCALPIGTSAGSIPEALVYYRGPILFHCNVGEGEKMGTGEECPAAPICLSPSQKPTRGPACIHVADRAQRRRDSDPTSASSMRSPQVATRNLLRQCMSTVL
jgi:hypothetical protein